jgi:hypothetical protein
VHLKIVIPRRPVSVNAAYARAGWNRNRGAGGGKGLFMTSAGKAYKNAVRSYAIVSRAKLAGRIPAPSKRSRSRLRRGTRVTTRLRPRNLLAIA